jgi:hypothetical protein
MRTRALLNERDSGEAEQQFGPRPVRATGRRTHRTGPPAAQRPGRKAGADTVFDSGNDHVIALAGVSRAGPWGASVTMTGVHITGY